MLEFELNKRSKAKLRQMYLIKILLELGVKSNYSLYEHCAIIFNAPLDSVEWKDDCYELIKLIKRHC